MYKHSDYQKWCIRWKCAILWVLDAVNINHSMTAECTEHVAHHPMKQMLAGIDCKVGINEWPNQFWGNSGTWININSHVTHYTGWFISRGSFGCKSDMATVRCIQSIGMVLLLWDISMIFRPDPVRWDEETSQRTTQKKETLSLAFQKIFLSKSLFASALDISLLRTGRLTSCDVEPKN